MTKEICPKSLAGKLWGINESRRLDLSFTPINEV